MRPRLLGPCVLACWLSSCAAPPALPVGFADAAFEAPEDLPLRLLFDADTLVASAVPIGPGALPPAVRTLVEAIEPGGTTVYAAREWSRRGAGFRVEKRYSEGPDQQYRSALITSDGAVLERSHTVPVGQVPRRILLAVMTDARRDVLRAEVVSDAASEVGWRITMQDGGARMFVCECSMTGTELAVHRVLHAEVLMSAKN